MPYIVLIIVGFISQDELTGIVKTKRKVIPTTNRSKFIGRESLKNHYIDIRF